MVPTQGVVNPGLTHEWNSTIEIVEVDNLEANPCQSYKTKIRAKFLRQVTFRPAGCITCDDYIWSQVSLVSIGQSNLTPGAALVLWWLYSLTSLSDKLHHIFRLFPLQNLECFTDFQRPGFLPAQVILEMAAYKALPFLGISPKPPTSSTGGWRQNVKKKHKVFGST